jgi:RHH-type proline utilization regulon transcriptional repressor/proline dehydrogenase/delta 1-pyrroline-5-carboxylate dehydrogenase
MADRLRVFEPPSPALRAVANRRHLAVIDAPVVANGLLELRWYLREQTCTQVVHRYGNVDESISELDSARLRRRGC